MKIRTSLLQTILDRINHHREQQHNPKKRKADYISAPNDLHAVSPEKSIDNNKPLSAPSSWTRPNHFSGGYGNAIPSLEELSQTTTHMLQQSHPVLFPSTSMTMFIPTLVTILAQSVDCITYSFVLIAANQLSTPVVSAVPVDSLLKETPFRSTGPGPPTGVSSQNFLNYFLDFSIFLNLVKMCLVRDVLIIT